MQVFCKGNTTTGLGVAGSKCEGKSTFFEGIAICEGALQNFAQKKFTTPDGKFVKSTRAFGCLGTSIGLSSNTSSNQSDTEGFSAADALVLDSVLAGSCLPQLTCPFHISSTHLLHTSGL